MSAAKPSIAVLGTGRMGAPIAGNLLSNGFAVAVWNRTAQKAQPLAAAGATVAPTPADAVSGADVVLTMLADGAATERAMLGTQGGLAGLVPGTTWIQMATVGIAWTERLVALASEHDAGFVDAPVSGSDGPARDAQLVVLASGDDALRARVDPIFAAIGRRTLWLGPAGRGSALKVVLNAWLADVTEAAAEGVALAEALGLDPRLFTQVLADLPLGSPYAITKANAMIARQFAPGFALRHARKDVGLALDGAGSHGLELPLLELIDERWGDAVERGRGEEDVAAAITTFTARGAGKAAARDR
jgi:3-hydroxyisobutyrate dehydrogenase